MSPSRILRATLFRAALALTAFGGMTLAVQAAVDISDQPTKNMSCSAGVCTPTAKSAVLNVDHLVHLLKTSDVKVITGSGAVTIEVSSALSWATASRLTLDANCNVSIKAPVTVAGPGGLTIVTNDGGSGCDLIFFPGGKADFWDLSSSLVINGTSFTLVNSIATLALALPKRSKPPVYVAFGNDYDASHDGTYHASPAARAVTGTVEGLGHTISNLTINAQIRRGCVGLFSLTLRGTVRDFILAKANVTGSGSKGTGTLVGCNGGSVIRSSADGSVTGGDPIGGLVGTNDLVAYSSANVAVSASCCAAIGGLVGEGGTIFRSHASGPVSEPAYTRAFLGGLSGFSSNIDQSFATGNVTAGDGQSRAARVGGLIGSAYSATITNSYSLGAVQGGTRSYVGGFVGELDGYSIGSSYSTGAVSGLNRVGGYLGRRKGGTVSSAYWDMDTSGANGGCGIGDCSGITGISDAELKSALPAGFDPAIWGQDPSINNGYPYLLANPPPK